MELGMVALTQPSIARECIQYLAVLKCVRGGYSPPMTSDNVQVLLRGRDGSASLAFEANLAS